MTLRWKQSRDAPFSLPRVGPQVRHQSCAAGEFLRSCERARRRCLSAGDPRCLLMPPGPSTWWGVADARAAFPGRRSSRSPELPSMPRHARDDETWTLRGAEKVADFHSGMLVPGKSGGLFSGLLESGCGQWGGPSVPFAPCPEVRCLQPGPGSGPDILQSLTASMRPYSVGQI